MSQDQTKNPTKDLEPSTKEAISAFPSLTLKIFSINMLRMAERGS